jgi:RHS repeat-associated protein
LIHVDPLIKEDPVMPLSPADKHAISNLSRTLLLATDNKNSVLAEIAGGKPNAIAYSAYGQPSAQQEVATGLGFNGELREAHIGWYLLGNGYRAYNPVLMRFHSPDSLSPFGKGGLNAYMYCVGDPVNFSDPTGHFNWSKIFSGVDKFFFGGADVTGSSRSKALSSSAPLGPMSPEKTGELKALTTLGSGVASTPGPTGTSSPPVHNLGDVGARRYEPGPVGFALPARVKQSPRANPNLLAGPPGPPGPTASGGDTWTSNIHGPVKPHHRLRGGDASHSHNDFNQVGAQAPFRQAANPPPARGARGRPDDAQRDEAWRNRPGHQVSGGANIFDAINLAVNVVQRIRNLLR